jgi:divalent metal cation (Fe/Co/Zn/Cd) transporter
MSVDSYHDDMAQIMATSPQAVGILVVAVIMLIAILSAAGALVSFLFTMTFFRIPEEHRKMALGQVWLICVPVFGVFWLYYTTRKLAESFDSFFLSAKATDEAGHRLYDIECPDCDYGIKAGLVLSVTTLVAHLSGLLMYFFSAMPMATLTGLGIAAVTVTVVGLVYFYGVFRIRRLIPDPESEVLPESYI